MVRYNGPNKEIQIRSGKFIRIGDTIHFSPTGTFDELAEEDGISGRLQTTLRDEPHLVDEGYVSFDYKDASSGTISLFGHGKKDSAPRSTVCRAISKIVFQELSPGFVVDADPENISIPVLNKDRPFP